MFNLNEKVAAVVGAGSGIGAAIAEAYAKQGALVACLDIDGDNAAETADSIRKAGGVALDGKLDGRDSAAVSAAFGSLAMEHGHLDIAVATPGINIRKPLVEYSDDDYTSVMDVNLKTAFNLMREAGRIMLSQSSGSILVISSISCKAVEPGQVIYAGTKAALAQMVRVFAAELGASGVRVNALAPGPVETPLTAPINSIKAWHEAYSSHVAMRRWARAEEMAWPAVFLASDAASYVNGSVLAVDGGWMDLDPYFDEAHRK